ncbi:MAG: ATP-binding cassette domain-containing protein [Bdellovibrionaceae bacterium]|nr:ATP-binding cassette domain-containing protein [Pseudobdellovibrionaceae bacterium]
MSSDFDDQATLIQPNFFETKTIDMMWLNKLQTESFLRFFPDKAEAVIERGEILNFAKGTDIFSGRSGSDALLIPLNVSLQIKVFGESIGLDKIIETVAPNELIGFREVLEGTDYPFVVQSVYSSASVFSIKRSDFLNFFSDPNDLKKIALLTASKSLFHFFNWLLDHGTPLENIHSLMRSSIERITVEKNSPIQLKKKSLILIEEGVISAERNDLQDSIKVKLHRGHWLGGSYFPENAQKRFELRVEESATLLLLDVQILMTYIPQVVLGRMISEPVIMSLVNKYDTTIEVTEIEHVPDGRSMASVGWRMDEAKLRKTSEPGSFAFTNLWNLLVFLEHNVNEKQILALANAKSFMNLGSTAQILEDMGFICSIVRISAQAHYKPNFPLVHYALGRPLLVLEINKKYALCLDPETGVVRVPRGYFEAVGMHYFLEVSESHIKAVTRSSAKISQMKPEAAGKLLLKHFFSLNRNDYRNVYIFKLFQAVGILAVPAYLLGLINQTVGLNKIDHLSTYITGLGIFIIFQVTAILAFNYFSNSVSASMKTKVHPFFFRLFLMQSPSTQMTAIKSGLIRSRMQIVEFVLSGLRVNQVDIKQYLLTLIVCLLSIGFYVWQSAVVLLIFALVGVTAVAYLRRNGDSEELNSSQLRQELNDLMTDLIKGFESIKVSRAENWMQDKIKSKYISVSRASLSYTKALATYTFVGRAIFQTGIALSLFVAIDESLKAHVSAQSAMVLTMFFNYSLGPFLGLLTVFFNFQMQGLYNMTGQFMRLDNSEQVKTLKVLSLDGGIRFERVSYRYSEKMPFVLNDVSFTISPGETVAIVGPSGSGKSTLARLIAKMNEPSGGKIFFDEVDSRMINPVSFQSQIGFVAQTPTLFSGTIAQNIALSDDVINAESILNAARVCGASGFIEKLPGGYSYKLKEGGRGLSGGERQLIAMARMFYTDPSIIVLDEATAYLDKITENDVSNSLAKTTRQKTVVYVVQNISIAKKADRILVVKQGRVIEMGNHNYLLSLNGEYAELYRNQVGFN